jgi:transcriptional regulator with PAS, ATPase and Fis domain
MISQGTFRQDLFYRLNVLTIPIPPLREHREDIPWLVEMMLSQLEPKLNRQRRITPAAINLILQYDFPGNVRELWNLIERLVVTAKTEIIDTHDLPVEVPQGFMPRAGTLAGAGNTLRDALEKTEATILKEALERFKTQMAAAKHLGVGQATISRKIRHHGLR